MALSAAENTFLHEAKTEAQMQLLRLGQLTKLDALWAGAPDYDTTITQADLDGVTSLAESEYTIAEITEALYALGVIKNTILDKLPYLSRLADLP